MRRASGLASSITTLSILAGVFALLLATSPALAAVVVAEGHMTVDGQDWEIPIGYNEEMKLYGVGSWDPEAEDFTGYENNVAGEFNISISGVLDPDPSISYGIAVTDFGAPSSFGFFFFTPIVLGAGATTVDASVVGGLTDFTGNGVTITPTLPDADADTLIELQIAEVGGPATNMGVDVGLAVSGGPGSSGAFYTYGSFADGPQPGPAGPWTTLSITVGFGLTGGSDTAVLTGFAQIVPEPSSVGLLAVGMIGVAYAAYRRRRRSS